MENKEICSICEGTCCKRMGCHFSPNDFKDLSFEGLKNEIDKGYISIDWWEGNPFCDTRDISHAYFLRIKNVGGNIIDPSWGGRCCLLTDTGCPLSYNERPKGGRELIPKKTIDGDCLITYSKIDCAIEWYKYNDILDKLVDHYNEIENPNSFDDMCPHTCDFSHE